MTGDALDRAAHGEELPVDSAHIEQTLAELWRVEREGEQTVTRAALWNVVTHTVSAQDHAEASQTLGRVAAAVPQRTIVIRADPTAPPELSSWISANCHLLSEGKQVCSEEIAIIAGGDRVRRIPPLVNALLIPDMPVAVWWVGDLPTDQGAHVAALLEPADRLIIDSLQFDHPADLELVARVAAGTTTALADLNWIRQEEWRVAAASIFDPPEMRGRLRLLRRLRVVAEVTDEMFFGQRIGALFFASWLISQGSLGAPEAMRNLECSFEFGRGERNRLTFVEMEMEGSLATIKCDAGRGVLTTNVDGYVNVPEGITRSRTRTMSELVVRALKQPASDVLLRKILPLAVRMAGKVT